MVGMYYSNNYNGRSCIIFGSDSGLDSLNLSQIDGDNGACIKGESWYSSKEVDPVGDWNGDGYDDVVVSSYSANNYNGTAYVIFGRETFDTSMVNLSPATSDAGLVILGNADVQVNESVNGGNRGSLWLPLCP